MSQKHMGSTLDDFLKEEGIFEDAQTQAVEEVAAWQLAEAMKPAPNVPDNRRSAPCGGD